MPRKSATTANATANDCAEPERPGQVSSTPVFEGPWSTFTGGARRSLSTPLEMNVTLTGQMTNTFPSKGAASSFIIKGIVSDADLGGLDAAIAEAVDVALGDTEAIAMLPPGLRQKLENQGKALFSVHHMKDKFNGGLAFAMKANSGDVSGTRPTGTITPVNVLSDTGTDTLQAVPGLDWITNNMVVSVQAKLDLLIFLKADPVYGDKTGARLTLLDVLVIGEQEERETVEAPTPEPAPSVSPKRLAEAANLTAEGGKIKAFRLE